MDELELSSSLWVRVRLAWDLIVSALRLRVRPVRRLGWLLGRDERGGVMTSAWHDVRLAARGLARTRGFTAVVVITLALGAGLNTALFSVVNAVLLRPLSYPDAQELVYVQAGQSAHDLDDVLLSGGDLRDLRSSVTAFEAVEGVAFIRQNLSGGGLPRQAEVGWVSPGFLAMLGAEPVVGRVHAPDDPPGTVVLGHATWADAFGSGPGVVGQSIQLDGRPHVIVGVLPSDFELHMPARGGVAPRVDVWKNPDSFWQNGDIWNAQGPEFGLLQVVGRLRTGASVADAQEQVNAVVVDLRAKDVRYEEAGLQATIHSLRDRVVDDVRATLMLLFGAVAVVLLIACANVANLMMVRAQGRRRELAVRMALGSPRGRVGRFLILESFVLAVVGAGAGLGIAWAFIQVVPRFAPADMPRLDGLGLDGSVLAYTMVAAVLTTLLVGLAPAWSALKTDPAAELGNARASGSGGARFRNVLVVAQVALSLILLVGAGLLTSSLAHLQNVEPGFEAADLFTFGVSIPGSQYEWPAEADRFYRDVESRVAALPGVESAGIIWPMPLGGSWSGDHEIMDGEPKPLGVVPYRLASEAYFPTAGIPLMEGRLFREGDQRFVVVVSATVAERAWPGRSPLGQTLRANPWGRGMEDFDVIGVVGDIRDVDLRSPSEGALYFDTRGWSWVDWEVHVVARSARTGETLLPEIREAVAGLDSEVPVAHPQAMEDLLAAQTASARFVLALLGVFALVAGTLAVVGLYGVVSYTVGLRRREIGIRMALGSAQATIEGMVVRRGLLLASVGVAIGVVGAVLSADLLEAMLFEVRGTDPLTIAAVAAGLGVAAALASWLPARRAGRTDPAEVLKAE